MKKCTKCGEKKTLDKFNKDARAPGGIRGMCKDCIRAGRKSVPEGVRLARKPAKKVVAKPVDTDTSDTDAAIAALQEENNSLRRLAGNPDALLMLEARNDALLTEKRDLNKRLKSATKQYGVIQTLVQELEASVTPIDPLPPAVEARSYGEVDEHLVMVLSDEHADEVVEPHKVGGLEEFNFGVALCRAERLVDTTIKFTKQTLSNHNFRELTIFALGDATSGEIHDGVTHSEYRNSFRNCLAIGQMRALMLRDLAQHYENVNIICLSGNHGRRTPKKDYDGAWNNWDYLVSEIAKMYCRDIPNLHFTIPDAFSAVVQVEGWGFHLQHGDDIKSWNSIPFYGVERKTRRLTALHHAIGLQTNYFVMGHFHMASAMADLKGETLINGAWPATSAYSYESFAGYREPSQMIFGVHAKHGLTWRMNVKLKDKEAEAAGPSRYHVLLSDPE